MKLKISLRGIILGVFASVFVVLIGYACVSAVLVNNQITESSKMINAGKALVMSNIKAGHGCIGPDKASLFQGDSGTMEIIGSYKKLSGDSCPTGCQLKYKFNDTGYKKDIHGKSVVVDVLNNNMISKDGNKTDMLNLHLPQNLNVDNRKYGDKCEPVETSQK